MNNDLVQIEIDSKQLAGMIKKYYLDTYQYKTCNVQFEAKNIKDRLKELDIFHKNNIIYSHMFKTVICGKIEDKRGNVNKYREELDTNGTKEVIANVLASQYGYNAKDISIGAMDVKNSNGGYDVIITGTVCYVDKKVLRKRL